MKRSQYWQCSPLHIRLVGQLAVLGDEQSATNNSVIVEDLQKTSLSTSEIETQKRKKQKPLMSGMVVANSNYTTRFIFPPLHGRGLHNQGSEVTLDLLIKDGSVAIH